MSRRPRTEAEPLIELEHVTVARGRNIVLHDVSLTVRRGEHIAILGPNGCGKSTLLKTMLCELYPLAEPDMRVRILGRERWDLTELRRRMGVVQAELPGKAMRSTNGFDAVLTGFFSSSTLWPNFTVTEAMRVRAEECLRLVGGELLRSKMVGEMSAGQQRRVMIARSLAGAGVEGEVAMLLLDEPSNALDLAAQRDLRMMLQAVAAQGVTLVLITHHVEDVLPEIERVVLMSDGRIEADGAKKKLLTSKGLSDLLGGRVRLEEHEGWYSAR